MTSPSSPYTGNLNTRQDVYNAITALKGEGYSPSDANAFAQQLSNNKGGVSFQEIQSALGGNQNTPISTNSSNNSTDYNQAINNTQAALDRLGIQQNAGYQGIDQNYQAALNQLLQGKNTSEQAYNKSSDQNKQSYVAGKNTVGTNAGSTLSGLLRLLGSKGAGGSSAAAISAPGAVARQATLQRADLGNQYSQNANSLDQNWGQYLQGYNDQVANAGVQKNNDRGSLENNIATNRASLLQTLAQLKQAQGGSGAAQPYLNQANSILNSLAGYVPQAIQVTTPTYQAPSLASYTSNQTTPTYQGQTQANDYTSPFLGALLGKKQPIAG